MKKKLLSALLFLCILVSGCSVTNLFSTTNIQNNQTSSEKKNNTNAENEHPKPSATEPDDHSNPPVTNQPESNGQTAPGENKNSPDSNDKTDAKVEKTSDINDPEKPNDPSGVKKSESDDQTPPKETTDPTPQPSTPTTDNSLLDDQIITKILIALIVLILVILCWLIYDRHKIKKKLNNLNSHPPKPNISPNISNNISQSPPTAIPPNSNQPFVNEQLTIRVATLQHIGARKEQQDSLGLSDIEDKTALKEKGLLAVVADGMGGLEGGAIISKLVKSTFLNNYNQLNFEPASFLYHTAESAELAVENYMSQTGINGGSTLVAVIIKNAQMHYISVGDSHIYLLRDNTLTLINKEHNLGALLKEKADKGEIDPREPYINPKRNSLTAYIGMGSFKVADRNEHPLILKTGDKILLCSDGVYNALGDDALITALANDASTAAEKIQSDILAQNIPSQDNFTAVILECVST